MQKAVLKIERKIKADRIRLFQAWLDPKDFPRWFISGKQIKLGSVVMDTRVGGEFQIDMLVNDRILPHQGKFLEIEEPSKIVFTWRSHATQYRDTLVTITFETVSGASNHDLPETLLTLVHEQLANETEISGHTIGWTSIIDHLMKLYEKDYLKE